MKKIVFVFVILGLLLISPQYLHAASCSRNSECVSDFNDNGIFETVGCRNSRAGPVCEDTLNLVTKESNGTTKETSPLCGVNNLGVNTAIGCLMAGDPKALISQLLGWGVVVGGGIAFLMIVLAGFQMTTAAGDPKKVQAARELLMSAISGLILIVLSVVFLNFIGVGILGLDSLGFKMTL